MRHIALFKAFKKSDDNKIASGILKKITPIIKIEKVNGVRGRSSRGEYQRIHYRFTIDGLNIDVTTTGLNTTLNVDGVNLDVDPKILKSIIDRCKYNLDDKKQQEDYTKKDLIANFIKKK
jgi:hypothetical protein